jgi:hypothetical protein
MLLEGLNVLRIAKVKRISYEDSQWIKEGLEA